MTEIEASVQAINSAQFEQLYEPETRLFAFPDNVQRTITLDRRFWQKFDFLDREWNVRSAHLQASFDWSLERFPQATPEFEAELRYWFKLLIEKGWSVYYEGQHQTINDNERQE